MTKEKTLLDWSKYRMTVILTLYCKIMFHFISLGVEQALEIVIEKYDKTQSQIRP